MKSFNKIILLIFLTIFPGVHYGGLYAQPKYNFNFGKNWEWGELMYGGYPVSFEALKILEQMQDDLSIVQGRFLFKNLSILDSVNQIRQLSEITNYDLSCKI